MNKLLVVIALFLMTTVGYGMISDAQEKGAWVVIYGENGKESLRKSLGDYSLVGVTESFFILENDSWIILYNEKGKEISRMSGQDKKVKHAVGENFTVEQKGWIVTYDMNCKEKSRKSK